MKASRNDRSAARTRRQLGFPFDDEETRERARECEREAKIRARFGIMYPRIVLLLLFVGWEARNVLADAETRPAGDAGAIVSIGKCCEIEELLVDDECTPLAETNETKWQPEFVAEQSETAKRTDFVEPKYEMKIGRPRCDPNEHQWHVYYYPSGPDRLAIVPTGVLRHYTVDLVKSTYENSGVYDDYDDENQPIIHYDYSFGHYCVDKAVLREEDLVVTYATLCVPDVRWTDTNYLMRHRIDPVFHAVSIICYLIVAIVYFVLPQLRDFVGNIITSITLCLVALQCASTAKIFSEFGNHVNNYVNHVNLFTDMTIYLFLVAAFFYLSVLGYYVWNIFRSRNVFLRVTDGKKYFYYSTWVWFLTVCIAGTATFAHFALEPKPIVSYPVQQTVDYPAQETVGWLGLSVVFISIAFTIVINLCLVLTTAYKIKRMSTYGRIHHKMKYNFRMFVSLYAIMSVGWFSLLLSQFKYDALIYCHIVVNLLQALLVLYVCVFGQRRVTFLLGKTCNCCDSGDNTEGLDWGEEMTAINAGY